MNTKFTSVNRRFCLLLLAGVLSVLPLFVRAQDIETIKSDPSYVWGQGTGETLKAADDNAVKDLISQISVNVDNQVETTISNTQSGDEAKSSVSSTGNLRVSSNVSLSNCKRIVVEEGSYFLVLRYVERAEIEKMFDARKTKVEDLIQAGERAEELYKIDDALRNFYWALKMVISIPEEHRSNMVNEDGVLLTTSLRERINNILDSVKVEVAKVEKEEEVNNVELSFAYMGSGVAGRHEEYVAACGVRVPQVVEIRPDGERHPGATARQTAVYALGETCGRDQSKGRGSGSRADREGDCERDDGG